MLIELAIVAAFFSLFLIVPVGLALWTALSSKPPLARVLILLGGTYVLGFFFSNPETPNGFLERLGLFALLMISVGIVWLMPNAASKLSCSVLFSGTLITCLWIARNNIDPRPTGIVYVGAGIVTITAVACLYRLSGFRIIRLTADRSDQELEIGTGKCLDDWIEILNQRGGGDLSRVQLVGVLRDDGVPFSWQRVLVDAYECVIGRSMIGQDESGRPQTVSAKASVTIRGLFQPGVGNYRWSIRQLMFLSFAVASIAALLNVMGVWADPSELFVFVFLSLGLGVIGLSAIHTFLKVKRSPMNLLTVVAAIVGFATVSCASLAVSGARPPLGHSDLWLVLAFGGTVFALCFIAISILIRHRGYRLVLVGRGRDPLGTLPCSARQHSSGLHSSECGDAAVLQQGN